MSIIEKVVAAATPSETAADREKARAKAAAVAQPDDWLSLILDHHLDLEDALSEIEDASDEDERLMAFKTFAVLLTAHAIAEEGVIYPALSEAADTAHANIGYSEQAMVKVQMAGLEKLDVMSQEFADKLGGIKNALLHHMFEEEGTWFPVLKGKMSSEDQEAMTERYVEEFNRYIGDDELEIVDEEE
jgi:hemerythrin superfamily protein